MKATLLTKQTVLDRNLGIIWILLDSSSL